MGPVDSVEGLFIIYEESVCQERDNRREKRTPLTVGKYKERGEGLLKGGKRENECNFTVGRKRQAALALVQ